MEFKVGDIVEAFGMQGEIECVNAYIARYGYLVVRYNGEDGKRGYFRVDGRLESWHKAPALKLIERPKKKVKKYKVLFNCDAGRLTVSCSFYKSKEDFEYYNPYVKFLLLLESTEIEVEE